MVVDPYFPRVGTGMPGTFTLTEPRWVRPVKYRVFQSSPPKARLVVAGAPRAIRPHLFSCGALIPIPPDPPQQTLPALSPFLPSGTPGAPPPRPAQNPAGRVARGPS